MTFKINQKGFVSTELILTCVIVVMVAGIGYFVYASNQKASDTFNAAAKSVASSPAKTTKHKTSIKPQTTTTTPTTAPTTVAAETKSPADSNTPAAGACGEATSSLVLVTIFPDVPSPRCVTVSTTQTLDILNNTDKTINAVLGSKKVTVAPNAHGYITDAFGNYLEVGVHDMTASPYPGPEIWLK